MAVLRNPTIDAFEQTTGMRWVGVATVRVRAWRWEPWFVEQLDAWIQHSVLGRFWGARAIVRVEYYR